MGLEGAQLEEAPLLGVFPILLDEVAHLLDGDVAVAGELIDLVRALDGDVHVEVAFLHLLHRAAQRLDRARDADGDEGRDEDGDRKAEDGQQDEGIDGAPGSGEKLREVGDHDDDPARPAGGLRGIEDVAPVHLGGEEAFPEREELGDPLGLEVPVDELLPRVVDDVARLVEDEDVARRAELDVLAEVLDDGVVQVDLDVAEGGAVASDEPADEGDDPGVAPVYHVLDVGGGHEGTVAPQARGHARGREAAEVVVRVDLRARRRGDDVGGCRPGGRAGARDEEDSVDVLAHFADGPEEERDPGSVPLGARRRRRHVGADVFVLHDDEGDVVHVGDVVVHDPRQLGRELHRALLRRIHESVAEEVERDGAEQGYRHHDDEGEGPHESGLYAAYPHPAPPCPAEAPSDLRYSEGVMPVRFLKSEAKYRASG